MAHTHAAAHDEAAHDHSGHDHGHDDHGHGHHGHGHHGHGHGLGGHSHAPSADADRRYIWFALSLLSTFLVIEVVLGIKAKSLALLTDAGHMLTDIAALVLALGAIALAARPARGRYTFGYRRAEILSAQINAVTLVLLGGWFLFEGVKRMIHPEEVHGGLVLGVAMAGIVINLAATWVLSRADRSKLNVEGAFQHILTDLYAFIGTGVAGVVVLTTGWTRADSVAALIVATIMLHSGTRLLIASSRVLLEASPSHVEPTEVLGAMHDVSGVRDVHDFHVWEVTSGFLNLSAHVLVGDERDCHEVRVDLQRALASRFGITHSTLQVDHAGDRNLTATELEEASGCCTDDHAPVGAGASAGHSGHGV
jgi:cobalt-zinc-cadmium efflux system protein